MQIEIFTEDSGTTTDSLSGPCVEGYFKGQFRSVNDLSTELASFGNVSIHIISEEYGYN